MTDFDGPRCVWRPDQPCPWRPVGKDAAIVRLVALGWSDSAIGRELGFSHHTVSHRIGRLCRMLGLHEVDGTGSSARRIRLASWAGAHGFGPPTP